jgi:hypothetical protein
MQGWATDGGSGRQDLQSVVSEFVRDHIGF